MKMVTNRSSSSPHFLHLRIPSLSISAYVLLLFGFSAALLYISQRQMPEADSKVVFSETPSVILRDRLWDSSSAYGYSPCVKPTRKYGAIHTSSDHYITVRSNGGLNQMRAGISDMVAVARIMNATLVIPQLDRQSFWQDSSTFGDIFDVSHFIQSLQWDVRVVQQLPTKLESAPRARKHFTSWATASYYEELAKSLWKEYQVIHVPKSDSRLANNDLPIDIQKLRCRTLYNALRFSSPIEELGKKLVERLHLRGRYIALHLRYEKDMLSFTGCAYGLNEAEINELRIMRENTNHWKLKKINSTQQRNEGSCPLTPKEVGIFLQALGYPSSVWIYIAAGEIFGGETYLGDLRFRFPNLIFKDTLATREELNNFASHATQAAALDYMISVESDVFVPSYTGNMARAVEGHRRFLGHRMTINPDRKGLVALFDKIDSGELKEGQKLRELVTQMHKFRLGTPRKRYGSLPGLKGRNRLRTEESFYENPYPECICRNKNSA
ncbi:hypothetical protein KSP39_PZI004532 [Platanthera zijinensis]|uniref:O-fucosyltransferase family protein n=1 Tax=Platanthera zijinensis TaxID=2320716 RepID=A0AAP0BWP9_9ASPA